MKFLIGSSYFPGGKTGQLFNGNFPWYWHRNNARADVKPNRIVVVCEAGGKPPYLPPRTDFIHLTGNLGHVNDLIENRKPHEFSGWSASMAATAMLAYADEADFLYKEEDCLCFGNWVQRMYADMGDGEMVFGRKMTSAPWMPCSQSLFLVRHRWIPEFIAAYLSMGGERRHETIGERKFVALEERFGKTKIRRLSFGCDRERPIPWDDPVMFFQQPSEAEVDEGERRGLI